MKKLTRVPEERANDAVHAALKHAIVTSALLPGERIHVAQLADQLGVSMTPVRNAVQLLAAEGLIEVRPRSGTFVARLSVQDLRETFELRCALECLAASKAALTMSDGQRAELLALLRDLEQPVNDEQARGRHERLNIAFHDAIINAAHNQRLRDAYQSLNAHIKIARIHAAEIDWRSRLAQEHREHQAIVDAILKRDAGAASAAMRDHILRASESLASAVEGKRAHS